MIPIALDALV